MSDSGRQVIFWSILTLLVLAALPVTWLWVTQGHDQDLAGGGPPTPWLRPRTRPCTVAAPASGGGGWSVLVEVVRLGLRDGHQLTYRTVTGALAARQPRTCLALQLAWPDHPAPPAGVCHSTSWRFEDADTLVLTYAATPDTCADPGSQPLREPAIVSSGDALRPAPAQLHGHHVAAHAVRHLAYLAGHGAALSDGQRRHPELWVALQHAAGSTPTGTCDCAHHLRPAPAARPGQHLRRGPGNARRRLTRPRRLGHVCSRQAPGALVDDRLLPP